jgi:hypothetical protein
MSHLRRAHFWLISVTRAAACAWIGQAHFRLFHTCIGVTIGEQRLIESVDQRISQQNKTIEPRQECLFLKVADCW